MGSAWLRCACALTAWSPHEYGALRSRASYGTEPLEMRGPCLVKDGLGSVGGLAAARGASG